MGMTSERDAEGAATPDGPALLQLIGIEKRFGSQTILQDFNLDVFDGEFLSFLGPSGCGKTTMLRIIAGFERTSSGQVILGGEDITARPPNRRDVSTVFQDYSLFPHLTVAENVAFGLVERKMSKSDIANRVGEMLDMVRLGDLADRKPAQISGGQKQRVALARSLAVRPRILLLDEPLGALDLNLRKDMQIELRSFQQRLGITFIFVTHDQEEALTMSDRIVVMKGGQIQQLGSAREVYDRPANRFVAGFIGETTLLRCERKTGSIASGRTMVSLFGQDIEVALPETGIPESENCLLSIRPEKILISGSASGCPNALAATIKTIIFKGAVQELILQLTKDVTIRATVSSAGATSCEGDNVFVGFLPADALLMAAD